MKQRILTLLLCLVAVFATASAQQKGVYDEGTMGAKVVEMETAAWGQSAPFNAQCFTDGTHGTNAKTGCFPLAFAIAMRYYEYPTEGTGSQLYDNHDHGGLLEVTDRTYDFTKMPLTNGLGWDEEQKAETAKFISHVAYAKRRGERLWQDGRQVRRGDVCPERRNR